MFSPTTRQSVIPLSTVTAEKVPTCPTLKRALFAHEEAGRDAMHFQPEALSADPGSSARVYEYNVRYPIAFAARQLAP